MKTVYLLLLLLCLGLSTAPRLRAQEIRPGRLLFAGEGRGRLSLPLAEATSYAERQNLTATGAAVRPAVGKVASFMTRTLAVPLTNPKPFIVLSLVWQGENLSAEGLQFAVRTSADGRQWGPWQAGALDGHADDDARRRVSRPLELASIVRFIQVRAEVAERGATPGLSQLEAVFYSPGETPASAASGTADATSTTNTTTGTCAKPAVTSRAAWGARTPTGTRSYTTVTHLVVHHEAGSNTSSDWAARVRSIESHHIDANGWADVGYNYLIDPNGVIYEGRSGGDNVIGAHFCGGNANTMGVCMLGDYSNVGPTAAAKESLKKILAWKAAKEAINPLGSATHPAAGNIPNVCGHRDNKGCTACPGNVLYGQLPTLRSVIQAYLDAGCGTPTTTAASTLYQGQTLQQGQSLRSPNGQYTLLMQGDGNLVLYQGSQALWHTHTWGRPHITACVMQGDGNLVLYDNSGTPHWNTGTWNYPGSYVTLEDNGNLVMYYHGTAIWASNTASARAVVNQFEATAAPNPLGNTTLQVDYRLNRAQHVLVAVYDMQGRRVAVLAEGRQPAGAQRATLPTHGLTRGLYLLRIEGEDATNMMRVLKQ
ncbi:N-acetylmuramoyl-L-alanine amidase [Hymenobacter weizhouensis]|uniref:N-acetylmuramoyl-L-alanine amidase n=1 Tax=Hymenobacter sp. YIM 151500-1 TaxID=2987689 RepID=UPI0022266887|nr:N-acetylmuramoyl-L-alanine amidase [Hymenobacter sp. YIM 151500-1]UYZ61416.1 N-acetylmuramoyl-L-alanine amidase [Hymenobacter sp. YIM 151500-1]